MAFINFLLTRLKGEIYTLDSRIPVSYILSKVLERIFMMIKGIFLFTNRKGALFIGKNATLKAKTKFFAGRGVTVDDNCYLDCVSIDGVILGDNVSVGKRTVIECTGSLKHIGKGLDVGKNVGLGRDCFYGCAGGIKIGQDTIIGNFVSLHAENHNFDRSDTPIRLQGVNHRGINIGENCWIGAKVTILDGVVIEDGCIIAAGSVVVAGQYKANSIYGGVPAKFLKPRC
ncbi:acyltransferase [Spirosoma pomorum]